VNVQSQISIIVVGFFKNQNAAFALWSLLGAGSGFWHLVYFWNKPDFSENELSKISTQFKGLDSTYMFSFFLWFLFGVGPALFTMTLDSWTLLHYGIRFYPTTSIIFATYGVFQGLFAVVTKVYPMGRLQRYVYGSGIDIVRIGKYQSMISLFTIAGSVLLYFGLAHLVFQ
jgi:hypothetical protein